MAARIKAGFRVAVVAGALLAPAGPAGADAAGDYSAGSAAFKREDLPAAIRLLRRAVDADSIPAKSLLGYIYDQAEENDKARVLYREAAEAGNVDAMLNLSAMYATGDGVEIDPGEALDLLRKAARHGDGRATAMLAEVYLEGRLGLDADPRKARELFSTAAERGYTPAIERLRVLWGGGTP